MTNSPSDSWISSEGQFSKQLPITESLINDITTINNILYRETISFNNNKIVINGANHKHSSVTAEVIDLLVKNQDKLAQFKGAERQDVLYHLVKHYPNRLASPSSKVKKLAKALLERIEKNPKIDPIAIATLRAFANRPHTETLGTPQVVVAPQLQNEIKEAIARIMNDVDPNYFENVSRIDVMMGGAFGEVSSDDPATVKINLSKVKQEVKRQLDQHFNQKNLKFDQNNPEHRKIFDEVLTRALIEVVAHEKGHVEDFKPKLGPQGEFLGGEFPHGESAAESEAQKVQQITNSKHPLNI